MSASSHYDTRTTALDPDLLSTPFRVQTNWHVITGGPSSGKSTLIDQLADKGFRTVAEIARQHIESEVAKGRTVKEIRADGAAVPRAVMDLQRKTEDGLCARDITFLDRGLPDCFAFFRLAGVNPNDLLAECFHHRYASVFVLDQLPFERDGTRLDSDADIAGYLQVWHTRDYSAFGYRVVRVPVLPPEERLAFVLESLSGHSKSYALRSPIAVRRSDSALRRLARAERSG
jgi:predicted ATPase